MVGSVWCTRGVGRTGRPSDCSSYSLQTRSMSHVDCFITVPVIGSEWLTRRSVCVAASVHGVLLQVSRAKVVNDSVCGTEGLRLFGQGVVAGTGNLAARFAKSCSETVNKCMLEGT